jgi:hypothetical protein
LNPLKLMGEALQIAKHRVCIRLVSHEQALQFDFDGPQLR